MGKKKKDSKETGRWTKDEHQRFMQGLMAYGKNWRMVEQIVGTRTASQVRSHAQKFFYRLDKERKKQQKQQEYDDSQQRSAEDEKDNEEQDETPQQIITLMRKNSKEDKSINVNGFLDSLKKESHTIEEDIRRRKSSADLEQQEIKKLQKRNSQYRVMTNMLESFSVLCEEGEKDESFFLNMIKKYKKSLANNKFLDLVDMPEPQHSESPDKQPKQRKRSFNLLQNTEENNKQLDILRKQLKDENYESPKKEDNEEKKEEQIVTPTIMVTAPEPEH